MGEFSIFHWIMGFALLAVVPIPFAKILSRTGHNPAWCLLYFIPLGNFIALWFFAFKPWPKDHQPHQT